MEKEASIIALGSHSTDDDSQLNKPRDIFLVNDQDSSYILVANTHNNSVLKFKIEDDD